jgi:hypothetical protein
MRCNTLHDVTLTLPDYLPAEAGYLRLVTPRQP